MPDLSDPDFDQLAGAVLARIYEARPGGLGAELKVVAAQLRATWNARGAADVAVVPDDAARAILRLDR